MALLRRASVRTSDGVHDDFTDAASAFVVPAVQVGIYGALAIAVIVASAAIPARLEMRDDVAELVGGQG